MSPPPPMFDIGWEVSLLTKPRNQKQRLDCGQSIECVAKQGRFEKNLWLAFGGISSKVSTLK